MVAGLVETNSVIKAKYIGATVKIDAGLLE